MKKARKPSGNHFAMLPASLVMHVSVTTLDHGPFRVLALLALAFRGRNNGAIGLTQSQALAAGIGGKNTPYRALHELEKRGLIEQTYPASRVPPRPAMYALSWLPVDDTDFSVRSHTPAHKYRDWSPPKNNFCVSTMVTKAVHHGDYGMRGPVHGPHGDDHDPQNDTSTVTTSEHLLESTIGACSC